MKSTFALCGSDVTAMTLLRNESWSAHGGEQ